MPVQIVADTLNKTIIVTHENCSMEIDELFKEKYFELKNSFRLISLSEWMSVDLFDKNHNFQRYQEQ